MSINGMHHDLMANIAIMSDNWLLIDEKLPHFIKKLQQLNMNIIALTASLTGSLESIKRIEVERYCRLKNLGIDFSISFDVDHSFNEMMPYLKSYPVYYKGVLCSNGEKGATYNKAHALFAFMKKFCYFPKAIILIDDKIKNLYDLSLALKNYFSETHFIGIEYLKVLELSYFEVTTEQFISFWQAIARRAHVMLNKKLTN